MKGVLAGFGLLIAGFTYLFVTSLLVILADEPEVLERFWLGKTGIYFVLFSAVAVVPAHLFSVVRVVKKTKMDWSMAVPFFVIPYMLGVTCQAMFL